MNRQTLIQLSLATGIGPSLIQKILPFIQNITESDLVQAGLTHNQRRLVHDALKDSRTLERHNEWIKRSDCRVVTLYDDEYPKLLKQIACPPAVLWVRGAALPQQYLACSLVGSRTANGYALRAIKQIIPDLVANNVITISGGARGADCWVHEQTLAAKGHTVVVAGCGLQHSYPAENTQLFEDIVTRAGTLISPFAPWAKPCLGSFPARNRIIAGLSQCCIVIQAAERSGALITAKYALEQNREVGAIPGLIDYELSAGTNDLLKQGAHVITSAHDILEHFSLERITQAASPEPEQKFSAPVQAVLTSLDTPATFDDLIAAGHTDPSQLQAYLYELQVAGKIKQNHAGFWERK